MIELKLSTFRLRLQHLPVSLKKLVDDSLVLLQIISYLLLSASSSAATRVDDWQSNWGKDKFPDIATASVGLSIVAFVSFALSCIISGYTLCKSA